MFLIIVSKILMKTLLILVIIIKLTQYDVSYWNMLKLRYMQTGWRFQLKFQINIFKKK